MFEGDFADTCTGKFPLIACADPGARTRIGVSGISGICNVFIRYYQDKMKPGAHVIYLANIKITSAGHITNIVWGWICPSLGYFTCWKARSREQQTVGEGHFFHGPLKKEAATPNTETKRDGEINQSRPHNHPTL